MGLRGWGHSLAERLRGHENTVCVGVINRAPGHQWYFFYDWDTDVHGHLEHLHKLVTITDALCGGDWEISRTRGGYHVLDWTPRTLEAVRGLFDLYMDWFPSDYLWTVPLTIRDGPKWRYRDGAVLSPPPEVVARGVSCVRPGRLGLHYYRNWE